MISSLLLLIIVSTSLLRGSVSDAEVCTGDDDDGASASLVSWSGPSVCLPFDDYVQLRKKRTDVPPPTSVSPPRGASSSALLLYRYMSPLWLKRHASFMETPSSVSGQTIEFSNGGRNFGALFDVKLIEANVLDDEKAYVVQTSFFTTYSNHSSPIIQMCDNNYCAGFWPWDEKNIRPLGGRDSVGLCVYGEGTGDFSPPQATSSWDVRLEIHPNSTAGIAYVSTFSMTYEYRQKLKLSRGLHFKVCRELISETFQFHLFEMAVYLNE